MAVRKAHLLAGIIGVLSFVAGPRAIAGAEPKTVSDLGKSREEAARKAYQSIWKQTSEGSADIGVEEIYLWSCRWLDAERASRTKPEDQLVAFAAHVERMKKLDELVKARNRSGTLKHAWDVAAAEYYRLDAEFRAAEAKQKR